MFESVKLALFGLWRNRMRSLLTILGIVIGISALIAVVFTQQGIDNQLKKDLESMDNHNVSVQLYKDGYPLDMSGVSLTYDILPLETTLQNEIAKLPQVEAVSFYTQRGSYGGVSFEENVLTGGMIKGIDAQYFDVHGYQLAGGRGFVSNDYAYARKVVILDKTAAEILLPGTPPIGRVIDIHGQPFTVIGVVKRQTKDTPEIQTPEDYYTYINQAQGHVFMPDATWPILYRYDEPQIIGLRTRKPEDMKEIGSVVAGMVNTALDIPEDSNVRYQSKNLMAEAQALYQMTRTTRNQLLWIAAIALLIGGVGLMNVMLISVSERKREIGLRKSMGAKDKSILMQFLMEASIFTTIGGLLGSLIGSLLSGVVARNAGAPVAFSLEAVLLSILLSASLGVLFGIYPAYKASKLPMDTALYRS